MDSVTVLWILGGVLVFLLVVFGLMNMGQASKDRRYAADAMAKATAVAAKEAARGAVMEREAMEAGKRERAFVFGCFGVLALFVVLLWAGTVAFRGISEMGQTSRYQSRQNTLIELDFGRTVRHGQTMEMMTESAWADAYAKRGRGPSPAQNAFMMFLLFVLGGLITFAVIVSKANATGYHGPGKD